MTVHEVDGEDFESVTATLGSGTRTVTRADGKVRGGAQEALACCASCTLALLLVDGPLAVSRPCLSVDAIHTPPLRQVARCDLFEPVTLHPGATYLLSMLAKGTDSFVGEDCLSVVVAGPGEMGCREPKVLECVGTDALICNTQHATHT